MDLLLDEESTIEHLRCGCNWTLPAGAGSPADRDAFYEFSSHSNTLVWASLAHRWGKAMKVLTHLLCWQLGMAQGETQTTLAERACLAKHATAKRRLVEIGVWHGINTRRLKAVMAPDGILYAVDPFPKGRLGFSVQRYIAYHEVARERNGSVRWIRDTGESAGRAYAAAGGDQIDFIFIDGDHTYQGLQNDWETWSLLVGLGGIVALHDSCSTPERQIDDAGSVRFVRTVILADPRFEVIEIVDSLTVLHRQTAPVGVSAVPSTVAGIYPC